jgi:hypothetical protein
MLVDCSLISNEQYFNYNNDKNKSTNNKPRRYN